MSICRKFSGAIILLICFCGSLFPKGEQEIVLEGSRSLYGDTGIIAGISFPPFSNARQIDFTVNALEELAIDRIRIAIDWRNREPEEGQFYWEPMDRRMKAARDNSLSVFLTVHSLCPDWARLPDGKDGACLIDENALKTFIEEIFKRYDHIDKIQFGNEWESGTQDGTVYSDRDSIEKFLVYNNILYDLARRLSPDTKVVLGGLTRIYPMGEAFFKEDRYPDFSRLTLAWGIPDNYLRKRLDKVKNEYEQKGIKEIVEYVLTHARYDMLDIHLYDDPENWSEYLSALHGEKPILVSEFGGPNSEFEKTSPDYQAKRMEAYIDAIEQLPVSEAYYFKLVDSKASYHQDSGLFFDNLRPKPARNVFAERLNPQE